MRRYLGIDTERRSHLKLQPVKRYMLGRKLQRIAHCIGKPLLALPWERIHYVEADIVKALHAGKQICVFEILTRMYARKQLQLRIRCALHADAEPVYARRVKDGKRSAVHRSGICLERYLRIARYVKSLTQCRIYECRIALG